MSTDKSSVHDPQVQDVLSFLGTRSVVALPGDLDKDQVLDLMVNLLAQRGRIDQQLVAATVTALQQRERFGTTGLGHGLALPHLRSHDISDFVGLIGVAPQGIDFASLDGWPTRIVILIISPFDQPQRHFEILSRLATLFSDKTLQYSAQLPRTPEQTLRFLGIHQNRTGA